MSQLVIIGQKVLTKGKVQPALIVTENGKIKNIILHPTPEDEKKHHGSELLRVSEDCIVLPGLLDSHVHVNEPGRTEWEGYNTATKAAAVGGVTTLADMPLNSIPPTTTLDNLNTKLEAAKGKCWMDVRFIGGVIPDNEKELRRMLEKGTCGFKCFLIHSGVDEFPHVNERQVKKALKELQGTDGFLMFHAEFQLNEEPSLINLDPKDYKTFLMSRPKEMENKAIEKVIEWCKESNVRCHIVHLASSEALPMIREAKKSGVKLSVETCFHYLFFDADSIPKAQPKFKCCPPIRDALNREKLCDALQEGVIDMVVSDHSPCTPDLKAKGGGDYMTSWGGISGLQFGVSVLNTECTKRGIELPQMIRWMTEGPAELIGVSHFKGKIEEGYDADFAIFNPTKKWKVNTDHIQFKNKLSAYEGQELIGVVEKTILRGKLIAENGKVIESDGPSGNFILIPRVQPPPKL